ncbi:FtsX-like permease family protein [Actinomadura sp. 6K520]|uniref:FtsX-like permease family protein n=1 Tax=Actinomadura sp. 6K520 TaxID=2530364 RepID=UPI001045213B|nr:FtsX-like permease family protein [Actinomadura sp. 6K520]TDE33271.1 FtsX-like permease family protein [Actinomadura sp. 6K520]
MLILSWNSFRQRWPLFVGAALSLAVGVALVSSAVQLAASATPPHPPAGLTALERERLRAGYDDVATIMIIAAILAAFLTVFIVATTFVFTVDQRRRDLALLRLLGVGRLQVRRVLVGEALLLGVAAIMLGLPLATPMARAQLWLVGRAGLLPAAFTLTWRPWPLVLGAGIGLTVAVLGVLAASRRAARIPPLAALRDGDTAARAMTASRWGTGLGLMAVTVALVALAPVAGLVAALALSLGVALCGGVALSQLSPLIVPAAGHALGSVLRGGTIGTLAAANVRHAVRRSASTAAPLIVLVSLVAGLAGTLGAVTKASEVELRQTTVGDLVVETAGRHADRISALPGVTSASVEIDAPVMLDIDVRNGGHVERERITSGIVAMDPAAYPRAHPIQPIAGTLDDVHGPAIAVMQHTSDGERLELGQRAVLKLGGRTRAVRVAAVLPEMLNTGWQVLVPRDLLPARVLAGAPAHIVLQVAAADDARTHVVRTVHEQRLGTVTTLDGWIADAVATQQRTNDATMIVLLGLSGLYAAMAVINAVVMAGADRGRELAIARMAGLTRRQILLMTFVESITITTVGLTLGAAVVTAALTGIALASASTIGTVVIAIPTVLAAAIAISALVVTAAASTATTWRITRLRPIHLATARD